MHFWPQTLTDQAIGVNLVSEMLAKFCVDLYVIWYECTLRAVKKIKKAKQVFLGHFRPSKNKVYQFEFQVLIFEKKNQKGWNKKSFVLFSP